ncbi:TolC family protein [Halonatronum saccharophilum]|uniref:TolC family protein n=1 Tax=Halonatronum saccharophilum TaxID=150060 RepID=UPI000486B046|nr:TolC family protein [Halonatronum saccharophilum]
MRSLQKNKILITLIITIILTLSIREEVKAEGITLKEAIEWGLKNNSSISQLKYEEDRLKRELAKIKAGLGWQVDFLSSKVYRDYESIYLDQYGLTQKEREEEKEFGLRFQGRRSFPWGLSIESNLSLIEEDPFEFEEDFDFELNLNQRLYPFLPIEAMQEYKAIQNELKKLNKQLEWEKGLKEIEFIEGYLNLLRIKESLDLAELNYKLAKDNLNRALRREEIGEGGRRQRLIAQVALKEGEIGLLQAKNRFKNEKNRWLEELSLLEGKDIILSDEDNYLEVIRGEIDDLKFDFANQIKLLEMAKQISPTLKAKDLDKKWLIQRRKWNKRGRHPQINLSGDYDYRSEDWEIGVYLSYNIFDGGQHKLSQEGYDEEFKKLEDEYQQLVRSLELDLKELINRLEESKLTLKEKRMVLDKNDLELLILKEELSEGIVSKIELEKKKIEFGEARVNLLISKDSLFLAKLRLVYFLGVKI